MHYCHSIEYVVCTIGVWTTMNVLLSYYGVCIIVIALSMDYVLLGYGLWSMYISCGVEVLISPFVELLILLPN